MLEEEKSRLMAEDPLFNEAITESSGGPTPKPTPTPAQNPPKPVFPGKLPGPMPSEGTYNQPKPMPPTEEEANKKRLEELKKNRKTETAAEKANPIYQNQKNSERLRLAQQWKALYDQDNNLSNEEIFDLVDKMMLYPDKIKRFDRDFNAVAENSREKVNQYTPAGKMTPMEVVMKLAEINRLEKSKQSQGASDGRSSLETPYTNDQIMRKGYDFQKEILSDDVEHDQLEAKTRFSKIGGEARIKQIEPALKERQSWIDQANAIMDQMEKDPNNAELMESGKQFINEVAIPAIKKIDDEYGDDVETLRNVKDFNDKAGAAYSRMSRILDKNRVMAQEEVEKDFQRAQAKARYSKIKEDGGIAEGVAHFGFGGATGIYDIAKELLPENAPIRKDIDAFFNSWAPEEEDKGLIYGASNVIGNILAFGAMGSATPELTGSSWINQFANPLMLKTVGKPAFDQAYKDTRTALEKDANLTESEIEQRSLIAGFMNGLNTMAVEGIFDEAKVFKSLDSKAMMDLIKTKGKVGFTPILKASVNKSIQALPEVGEEEAALFSDNFTKGIINAVAQTSVYKDEDVTMEDIVKTAAYTAIGTLITGGVVSLDSQREALTQMAKNPQHSIAALNNLVKEGVRTQEEIQPYVDKINKYAKSMHGIKKDAPREKVDEYFKKVDEQEQAKAQYDQNSDNEVAEPYFRKVLSDKAKETKIAYAEISNQKKPAATTEIDKIEQDLNLTTGVDANQRTALDYAKSLESTVPKGESVIPYATTEANTKLSSLKEQQQQVKAQLIENPISESLKKEDKRLEQEISKQNDLITGLNSIVPQTAETKTEVKPESKEASTDSKPDTTARKISLEEGDQDSKIFEEQQDSQSMKEDIISERPEGYKNIEEAKADDKFNQLIESYKNEGYTESEVMSEMEEVFPEAKTKDFAKVKAEIASMNIAKVRTEGQTKGKKTAATTTTNELKPDATEGSESTSGQTSKIKKATPVKKQTISDKQAVEMAREQFPDSITPEQADEFVNKLVEDGSIAKSDKNRIRSRIHNRLNVDRTAQSRKISLEEDDEQPAPLGPEVQEEPSEEEVERFESGRLPVAPLGDIGKEQTMAFNATSALVEDMPDFLSDYAELQSDPTKSIQIRDRVVARMLDRLNERFGTKYTIEQINEQTQEFDPQDSEGNVLGILNKISNAIMNDHGDGDFPGSFAHYIKTTTRKYIDKEKTIESQMRTVIDSIAKEYTLAFEDSSSLMEIENTDEDFEEQVDDDNMIQAITDKSKGGKETRIADALSALVDLVFVQKAEKATGISIRDGGHAGIIHSLFQEHGSLVGVFNYIQRRLNSETNPVKNEYDRVSLEAIGEVLYKVVDKLANETKDSEGAVQNVFNTAQVIRTVETIFSNIPLEHTAVSINPTGRTSYYGINRNKAISSLKNRISSELSSGINTILQDPAKKADYFRNIAAIRRALASNDIISANEAIMELMDNFSDNPILRDSIKNTVIKSGLDIDAPTLESFRSTVQDFLSIMSVNTTDTKNPVFEQMVLEYEKRTRDEFGNYSTTQFYSQKNKANQSSMTRPNRLIRTISDIARAARGLKTKKDRQNIFNLIDEAKIREFESPQRRDQLRLNPLAAIPEIARKLRVRVVSELVNASGNKTATTADKFTRNDVSLIMVEQFANSVVYDNDTYDIIEQINDSPMRYTVTVPRIFNKNGKWVFSKNTSFEGEVLLDDASMPGLMVRELQRSVDAALKQTPGLTTQQMRLALPSFYNVRKSGDGYQVYLDQNQLKAEAKKQFVNYVNALSGQYINFQTSDKIIESQKGYKAVMAELERMFDEGDINPESIMNEIMDGRYKDMEVPKGTEAFMESLSKNKIFNKPGKRQDTEPTSGKSVNDFFQEFVVNNEINSYYLSQITRGNNEYYMGKDTDEVTVRSKMFNSPGLPVRSNRDFKYVIMNANIFDGKDHQEKEISDKSGNKKTVLPNSLDGVMFISEESNQHISASMGAMMGYGDQYKYSMAGINQEGVPTGHKAMQVVVTAKMAASHPVYKYIYDYMKEHGLNAVLHQSAEKIKVEGSTKANYDGKTLEISSPVTHTAKFSDIHVQLPINQGLRAFKNVSDPEQKTKQAYLYQKGDNDKDVRDMQNASAARIGAESFLSSLTNKPLVDAIRGYKLSNIQERETAKAAVIKEIEKLIKDSTPAVAKQLQTYIDKIQNGYIFETDEKLLYNIVSARYKGAAKSKAPGMYMSIMTSFGMERQPKFNGPDGLSEVIVPMRYKEHLMQYANAKGEVIVTAMKVPYNNAATQLQAKVIFDASLDDNGSNVIVPPEFLSLSNSDMDGDFLFIHPTNPSIDLNFHNKVLNKLGTGYPDPIHNSGEFIKYLTQTLPSKQVKPALDTYIEYLNNVITQADVNLFKKEFASSLQLEQNDVSEFLDAVAEGRYTSQPKNLYSVDGKLQRVDDIQGSGLGIGMIASAINVYNTILGISTTGKIALRKKNAPIPLLRVMSGSNEIVLDPSVMEYAATADGKSKTNYEDVVAQANEKLENDAQWKHINNPENDAYKKMTSEEREAKKQDILQRYIKEAADKLMPAITGSAKKATMNGMALTLQLFVDGVKKGYLAQVGLNSENILTFGHLAMRLSMTMPGKQAQKTAIDFINQPVIKAMYAAQSRNPLIKEEYRGYDNTAQSMLMEISERYQGNEEVEKALNNPVADLTKISHEYNGRHVSTIDFIDTFDSSNDISYVVAQVEALKAMIGLSEITNSIQQFTLNRKKFEEIPTNIEEARSFMVNLQNMGLMGNPKDMLDFEAMVQRGATINDLRRKFEKRLPSNFTYGTKYTENGTPETAEKPLRNIKMLIEAKQKIGSQDQTQASLFLQSLYDRGLSDIGAANFIDYMIMAEMPKVINGGVSIFDDPTYRERMNNFFMDMASNADAFPMFDKNIHSKITNAISRVISTHSGTKVQEAIRKFADGMNRIILKDNVDKYALKGYDMENALSTYNLNAFLTELHKYGPQLFKNGFVRSLEVLESNTDAPAIDNIDGYGVFTKDAYLKRNGRITSTTNFQPFLPQSGDFEQASKDNNLDKMTEIALSRAIEELKSEGQPVEILIHDDGTVFMGYTGEPFQLQMNQKAAKTPVLGFSNEEMPINSPYYQIRMEALYGAESTGVQYNDWVNAMKDLVSDKMLKKPTPRYIQPTQRTISLSKNYGNTDFSKEEFDTIRKGLEQLANDMSQPTVSQDGKEGEPIYVKIMKDLESRDIFLPDNMAEIMKNPYLWIRYFADQKTYSQARNLMGIAQGGEDVVTPLLINEGMINEFRNPEGNKYLEDPSRVFYENPTIAQYFPKKLLEEVNSDSKEADNISRFEYIHTKVDGRVELYKRVGVGYTVTKGRRYTYHKPVYKFVKVHSVDTNGEATTMVNTFGTEPITTTQDLIDFTADVLFSYQGSQQNLEAMMRNALAGVGGKTIDIFPLFKDIELSLSTQGDNFAKSHGKTGTFSPNFIPQVYDFIKTTIQTQDVNKLPINQSTGRVINTEELKILMQALNVIQSLQVNSEDLSGPMLIDNETFSDIIDQEVKEQKKMYYGRKFVSKRVTMDESRRGIMDVVRDLLAPGNINTSKAKTKTLTEWIKTYTPGKSPKTLGETIDIFQNQINRSEGLSALSMKLRPLLEGQKVKITTGKDYMAAHAATFPSEHGANGELLPGNSLANAFYDGETIYINGDNHVGDSGTIIMHEAMHAYTMYAINDPLNTDLREDLTKIYDEIVKQLNTIKTVTGYPTQELADAGARIEEIINGTSSPLHAMEEILSYAFTDSDGKVARLLGGMSAGKNLDHLTEKSQGLWGKLKQAISKALTSMFRKQDYNTISENSIFDALTGVMEVYDDRWNQEKLEVTGLDTGIIKVGNDIYQSVEDLIQAKGNTIDNEQAVATYGKIKLTEFKRKNPTANQYDIGKAYDTARAEMAEIMLHAPKVNTAINEAIAKYLSGDRMAIDNMIAEISATPHLNLQKVRELVKDAIRKYDGIISTNGEVVAGQITNSPYYSTQFGVAGSGLLTSMNKEGELIINVAGIGYESKNKSILEGDKWLTPTTIEGFNQEEQREIVKAAIQGYLMEQTGATVKMIRFISKSGMDGMPTNEKVRTIPMSAVREIAKELLVQSKLDGKASAAQKVFEEFENGTWQNYNNFYLNKAAQVFGDRPSYEQWKAVRSNFNTEDVSRRAYTAEMQSWKYIEQAIKSGSIADLKTNQLTELIGHINKLTRDANMDVEMAQITRGLTELVMMDYTGKQQKALQKIYRDANLPTTKAGILSHMWKSLNQLPSALGVDSLINQLKVNTIKNNELKSDFQRKLFDAAAKVIKEKTGSGKLSIKMNRLLSQYELYPDRFNDAFTNLIDESSMEITGRRKLKSLRRATSDVAMGKMTQSEFDLLKTIADYYIENIKYTYNSIGVSGHHAQDDNTTMSLAESDDLYIPINYHPANSFFLYKDQPGVGKMYALAKAYEDKIFGAKRNVLERVIPKFPDPNQPGKYLNNMKAKAIVQEYVKSYEKSAVKPTDEQIQSDFDNIVRNAESLNDEMNPPFRNVNSISIPGTIRSKKEPFSGNIMETFLDFSSEVAKARNFVDNRGLYDAIAVVADMNAEPFIAEFVKREADHKLLGKAIGNVPEKAALVTRELAWYTRILRLGLKPMSVMKDFAVNSMHATISTHMLAGDDMPGAKQWYAMRNIPVVAMLPALLKAMKYRNQVYEIMQRTGMFHNPEISSPRTKSVVRDILNLTTAGYALSAGIPKAIMTASQFKWSELQAMKLEGVGIIPTEDLVKAMNKVEYNLGMHSQISRRSYTGNALMSAAMQFKSWMPDYYASRWGVGYTMGGVPFEGRYRTTFYKLTRQMDKSIYSKGGESEVYKQAKGDAYRSAVHGMMFGTMAMWWLWDYYQKIKQRKRTEERLERERKLKNQDRDVPLPEYDFEDEDDYATLMRKSFEEFIPIPTPLGISNSLTQPVPVLGTLLDLSQVFTNSFEMNSKGVPGLKSYDVDGKYGLGRGQALVNDEGRQIGWSNPNPDKKWRAAVYNMIPFVGQTMKEDLESQTKAKKDARKQKDEEVASEKEKNKSNNQ